MMIYEVLFREPFNDVQSCYNKKINLLTRVIGILMTNCDIEIDWISMEMWNFSGTKKLSQVHIKISKAINATTAKLLFTFCIFNMTSIDQIGNFPYLAAASSNCLLNPKPEPERRETLLLQNLSLSLDWFYIPFC